MDVVLIRCFLCFVTEAEVATTIEAVAGEASSTSNTTSSTTSNPSSSRGTALAAARPGEDQWEDADAAAEETLGK